MARRLAAGALLAVALLCFYGCGAGDMDTSRATQNAKAEQKYNQDQLKKNPPPPGEGPGN